MALLMNVFYEMAYEAYFAEVELGFCSQDLIRFPTGDLAIGLRPPFVFGLKGRIGLLTRRRIPRTFLCVVPPVGSRSLSWHDIC